MAKLIQKSTKSSITIILSQIIANMPQPWPPREKKQKKDCCSKCNSCIVIDCRNHMHMHTQTDTRNVAQFQDPTVKNDLTMRKANWPFGIRQDSSWYNSEDVNDDCDWLIFNLNCLFLSTKKKTSPVSRAYYTSIGCSDQSNVSFLKG